MIGPFANENRGARERGTVMAMEEAGVKVVKHRLPDGMGRRSKPGPSGHHGGNPQQPGCQGHRLSGGQLLGNVPIYMQAAKKNPGEIFNFGFDTSPQIVEAFNGGWVQPTADQQPFLQGYLPIVNLCQQVVYGLGPINVDTGAGFVTTENYKMVGDLATEGLR